MNDLCTDIGFGSLNKAGEELCGDHVEIVPQSEGSTVLVLADGLGSGVKASILSILTAKIIATMMAADMSVEECVSTIAQTLPVCATRKVAYSTFTILRITNGTEAELIQYDNPAVILLRSGENVVYPMETVDIAGKKIQRTKLHIEEGDVLIVMSDGAPHAGLGVTMNFGWTREKIIDYIKPYSDVGFTAKTLSTMLLDECYSLYGGEPGDDTTVCTVRIRRREPMNLLIGPPSNRTDCNKMMSLFFSKEGKHIVCGGTTSTIAADYLRKPLNVDLSYFDNDIPPTAAIEGVDLVTEGVITINRVLTYAQDYLKDNSAYKKWSTGKDGASRIARLLFEEATDINFFVGMAVNPAHQDPTLPINFSIKMQLVDQLAECLKKMGKKIKVSYF